MWEANHVWLVFDLVIFWTCFPHAFASVMTAAALPLWLAVGGVVQRPVPGGAAGATAVRSIAHGADCDASSPMSSAKLSGQ